MEFQLSYFKSKKMMLWKCCTQYASKFGKLSTGHRTGKCQFSFQSQRKAMPVKVAQFSSVSSVAQSCPTLCDPMNCSKPGLPVHHQLLEFTKTHIHRVSDAIQPSHPLSSPSPLAPNPSQRSNCQHPLDHGKSKRVPEKHLFLLYWLCQSLWLCGSQ